MMGVEFVQDKKSKAPAADLVAKIIDAAVQKGLIMEAAGTYNNVIRFLCQLCATDAQIDAGLEIYEAAIKECL